MLSGIKFDFPIDKLFEIATDNLNLIAPVLVLVLGVLMFDLLMNRISSFFLKILSFLGRNERQDDDYD